MLIAFCKAMRLSMNRASQGNGCFQQAKICKWSSSGAWLQGVLLQRIRPSSLVMDFCINAVRPTGRGPDARNWILQFQVLFVNDLLLILKSAIRAP